MIQNRKIIENYSHVSLTQRINSDIIIIIGIYFRRVDSRRGKFNFARIGARSPIRYNDKREGTEVSTISSSFSARGKKTRGGRF